MQNTPILPRLEARRLFCASVLVAGMLIQITGTHMGMPAFSAALGCYIVAGILAPRRPVPFLVTALVATMGICGAMAVFTTRIAGDHQSVFTGSGLVIFLFMLPLIGADLGSALAKPLALGAVVIAVSVLVDAATGHGRAMGFAANPNHAAGFLVFAVAVLMRGRYGLVGILCAIAVAFTGSRLAVLTLFLLAGYASLRGADWKTFAVLGLLIVVVGLAAAVREGAWSAGAILGDLQARLALDTSYSLIPTGFHTSRLAGDVPHNAPMLLAQEWGMLAAACWVILTGRAIWLQHKARRGFTALALASLSMFDLYTWLGAVGAPWWTIIGEEARQPAFITAPRRERAWFSA